ncbi:hypothetical protein LTR66_005617 [Elasticomyces elasticus]|nr:hypothetical protein LTR66_005617 [Elasticomyces elasticus]
MAASGPSNFSVDGKTAIVTGAGSGINLAFATLLLSRNCNVVFADLNLRPEAQKVVDEYSQKQDGKPRAVFAKTDVVKWDDLSRMFDVANREFGGIDIVCPGAGVFEPHWSNFWHPPGAKNSSSRDSPHGDNGIGHYATLDINITHPIRATQLAIAAWMNSPNASHKVSPTNPKRVVHITSVAGQVALFNAPLYAASKHAISGFIRSMGSLDSLGIRVNGVAPGLIKTPLWTDHPEKMLVVDEENDVFLTPEEVAEAMLKCVQDEAIGGGWVLEVTKNKTRKVEALNDPGPSGDGSRVSHSERGSQEVFQWLGEEGWGMVVERRNGNY